ncbi:MAG: rhodanese-like domain-containing protein [candidate division KSB1 bacterium]
MYFRMLYDDQLAQAAYLIGCQRTGEALIIDPERDVERYISAATREGLKITAITETHIHADYLSGSRELAERTGARLYLSDAGDENWKYRWLDQKKGGGSYNHQLLRDGDSFKVGNIKIDTLHTPGHTPEHLSFLVTDLGGGANEPLGIVSGDFVFVGDVGRPDLLETAAGQEGAKEPAARLLYHSLQRFKVLPEYLQVWPGHGAGSACGKALGAVPQSTVGYEKRFNAAIAAAANEQQFVQTILEGQPEPPLYFARMKQENKNGPALLEKFPEPMPLTANALRELLAHNATVVDTRSWKAFTQSHLPGALWAPLTSYYAMATGSYIQPGTPIYLLVEESQLHNAVAGLIRIGLDHVAGYITPEVFAEYQKQGGKTASTAFVPIANVNDEMKKGNARVLDVRGAAEFEAGHLKGAMNIAYTRLPLHLHELPKEQTYLLHCRTDNRSAIAAALLQRHGYNVVHLGGGMAEWQAQQGEVVKA